MHTRQIREMQSRRMDPTTARSYWNLYVEKHGGPVGASKHLGIPYSTVAGVCNGSRGIGRELARRMHERDPLLDLETIVWVTADKKRA